MNQSSRNFSNLLAIWCSKNVQTIIQLCLFQMLVRLCSTSFKLGFSNMWTKNFQIFNLDLEKAEKSEIKLPISAGSQKKQESSRKHLLLLYWLCQSLYCADHNKLQKILQEMGIPDHLTCHLRNQYTGQEATVRTRHGTMEWFQIGKGVRQGCILSPCLFNLHAEYIMRSAGLDEAQAGIKIAQAPTSDMQMTLPYGRKWGETKACWWKWKRRVKKLV